MKRLAAAAVVLLGSLLVAAETARAAEITVECSKKRQIIHGFGTCMKSWGDPVKDAVAKQQYNPEIHKLYAQDLGLSMVRIPISKWVLEGTNPYKIPTTTTPEMMNDPSAISYEEFSWENTGRARATPKYALDWARALVELNPDIKVFGSVWSPPHWMKEKSRRHKFHWSKYGASSCGGRLSPRYYTHYARYLAEWSKGLKAKFGIDLYAISIQNELYFYEPYDSCIYAPREFAAVVKEVGRVFRKEGIKTKIMGPEDMTKFPDRLMRNVYPVMKDSEAKDYLDIICSHGYADGIESNLEAADAGRLWDMMKGYGKEYWMTETGAGCGYWKDSQSIYTSGRRKGQKRTVPGALTGLATMMHNALVYGNASVWTTWQFLGGDPECQHSLVYVTLSEVKPTKKYYVQKHYSRFIKPQSRRVEAGPDGKDKILVSAYVNDKAKALTLVLQNHNERRVSVSIAVKDGPRVKTLETYLTTEDKDCERTGTTPLRSGRFTVALPGRCVATLVGEEP